MATVASLGGCASDGGGDGGPSCIGGKCDDVGDVSEQSFEYIVVGSGAGGGPLAARLAEAGHSVLLLEAGEDTGGKLEYQVPALHPQSTEDPAMAWSFFVRHYGDDARAARDTKLTERGILYPRGAALGGSTAVNAMITVAAKNSDWDRIAAITGDDSWRAEAMHRYRVRVEEWLSVEPPDAALALRDIKILFFVGAAVLEFVNSRDDGADLSLGDLLADVDQLKNVIGRNINDHIEAGDAEGVFSFPLATEGGRRNGARERILAVVDAGAPLTVRTRALVTNVVFADEPGRPRAVGVEFLDGSDLYRADPDADDGAPLPARRRVFATREVILSAGAFNTPQLLKLSGVGPRAELERFGIPVVHDLPGVGENLQDRYEVGIVVELDDDFSLLDGCDFARTPDDPCLAEWQAGGGPYTSNGGVVSILTRSSPERPEADLHIFGVPGVFKGYYPGYSADGIADRRHFTWVILKGHTENRAGSVVLRSSDPRDWPDIHFRYFDEGDTAGGEDQRDVEAVVDGIELVRDIIDATDTGLLFTDLTEVWPGPAVATRAELGQWVEDEAWGHHASCSARIGADDDPMAVLDSRFRVRGVDGLRVVDASVFPRIPGTFIALPTYMISEKAAEVILEDAAATPIP